MLKARFASQDGAYLGAIGKLVSSEIDLPERAFPNESSKSVIPHGS